MKSGFVYILSNLAMPGLVKIGRTERHPQLRARELRTTGVPHPFLLEHFIHVDDCHHSEAVVHAALGKLGVRSSHDREFFHIDVIDAIALLDKSIGGHTANGVDFSNMGELGKRCEALKLPSAAELGDYESVLLFAENLAEIGRGGYPMALQQAAYMFEASCPSAPRFKDYWREFLLLARMEATRHLPASSNGRTARAAVGSHAADYISILSQHRWLNEEDFKYISDFLVAGDSHQYGGFISQVRRYNLSKEILLRVESL